MTTAPVCSDGGDSYLRLVDRAREVLSLRADPRRWIEANLWLRSKDQRMVLSPRKMLSESPESFFSSRRPGILVGMKAILSLLRHP